MIKRRTKHKLASEGRPRLSDGHLIEQALLDYREAPPSDGSIPWELTQAAIRRAHLLRSQAMTGAMRRLGKHLARLLRSSPMG